MNLSGLDPASRAVILRDLALDDAIHAYRAARPALYAARDAAEAAREEDDERWSGDERRGTEYL